MIRRLLALLLHRGDSYRKHLATCPVCTGTVVDVADLDPYSWPPIQREAIEADIERSGE